MDEGYRIVGMGEFFFKAGHHFVVFIIHRLDRVNFIIPNAHVLGVGSFLHDAVPFPFTDDCLLGVIGLRGKRGVRGRRYGLDGFPLDRGIRWGNNLGRRNGRLGRRNGCCNRRHSRRGIGTTGGKNHKEDRKDRNLSSFQIHRNLLFEGFSASRETHGENIICDLRISHRFLLQIFILPLLF
jgi:hypothetical protein